MLHCCWRNAQTTHPRIFLPATAYVRDCNWLKPKHALHVLLLLLLLLSRWRSCRKHGIVRLRFSKEEKFRKVKKGKKRVGYTHSILNSKRWRERESFYQILWKKKRYSFLFGRLIMKVFGIFRAQEQNVIQMLAVGWHSNISSTMRTCSKCYRLWDVFYIFSWNAEHVEGRPILWTWS